ncbi:hypothetical protein JM664_09950 [Rhodobacteraceae bacterium MCCB 386]|nr:hypothetical protein [Roseitranquillus sediminis]
MAAALAACVPISREQVAREAARAAVQPILADRFPGLPVQTLTDCVIDNAAVPELYELAETTLTGLTPSAIDLMVDIARRPATQQCLAARTFGAAAI